jgi:hypothetical protein
MAKMTKVAELLGDSSGSAWRLDVDRQHGLSVFGVYPELSKIR